MGLIFILNYQSYIHNSLYMFLGPIDQKLVVIFQPYGHWIYSDNIVSTWSQRIKWGGRTRILLGTLNPPMGSEHFLDRNLRRACYFMFVSFQNAFRQNYEPENYQIHSFIDKPNCYGVDYYGYKGTLGYVLQFGGFGGNCGN